MSKTSEWLIDIEEKTAALMVSMSAYMLDEDKAFEMVQEEFERVRFGYTRVDFNALVDEAMGIEGRTARTKWLNKMYWEFEKYMRPEMWDKLGETGIHEDDADEVLGAFRQFCEHGYVVDDDGHAFFVDAFGNVHDYDAAVNLMDEELREELHRSMSHSTPQEFIERYAKDHREKFGEGFAPYEGGAW